MAGFGDRHNCRIARVFFDAATKVSTDSEDILPQEGGPDGDHSVFHVFSLLFPEIVGSSSASGELTGGFAFVRRCKNEMLCRSGL